MAIPLNQAERDRFVAWLEDDVADTSLLLEQMEKLPGLTAVITKLRAEAAAEQLIIAKLKSTHGQSI